MINSIEFYCGISREMKALKCSEMCVKTDDMIELVTRLRQAEKDAARYRWLRDESWGCDKAQPLPKVMSGRRNQEIVLAEKAMDDAIDEAMQCK